MGLFSSIKENLNEAKRIDNIVKETCFENYIYYWN